MAIGRWWVSIDRRALRTLALRVATLLSFVVVSVALGAAIALLAN